MPSIQATGHPLSVTSATGAQTWWAADVRLGGHSPGSPCRLMVATTDPATLLEEATWYPATNCPTPTHPVQPAARTHPPASRP